MIVLQENWSPPPPPGTKAPGTQEMNTIPLPPSMWHMHQVHMLALHGSWSLLPHLAWHFQKEHVSSIQGPITTAPIHVTRAPGTHVSLTWWSWSPAPPLAWHVQKEHVSSINGLITTLPPLPSMWHVQQVQIWPTWELITIAPSMWRVHQVHVWSTGEWTAPLPSLNCVLPLPWYSAGTVHVGPLDDACLDNSYPSSLFSK